RNLIENAVVHAPPGTEVTVTVDRAGRIEVADRGSGVPPKDRENIFKRFWRGAAEKKEGAGLGLAIVREIMRAHRGSWQRRGQSGRWRPLHPRISPITNLRLEARRQAHCGKREMSGGRNAQRSNRRL